MKKKWFKRQLTLYIILYLYKIYDYQIQSNLGLTYLTFNLNDYMLILIRKKNVFIPPNKKESKILKPESQNLFRPMFKKSLALVKPRF